MELTQRISALVDYSGLSIRALSEKLGFKTPQLLYELQKGNTKTLSKKVQDAILNTYPEINHVWLLSGDGEMLVKNENKGQDTKTEPATNIVSVPLINLDARGGFMPNEESGNQYPRELIPWNGARVGDFAMEVSGISMMPQIPPGSRILLRQVDGWREYLEKNLPYVIELNDERRLLKVVQKSEKGDAYFDLESYNPQVPTESLPVSMVMRIYKVIGTMVNYGF